MTPKRDVIYDPFEAVYYYDLIYGTGLYLPSSPCTYIHIMPTAALIGMHWGRLAA